MSRLAGPKSLLCWLAALVLALPAAYLFAMGPVWGLAMRHPERADTAIMLYGPVVRIAEEHPALDRCIGAYVEQWYPKGVSRYGSITMKQLGKDSPASGENP